MLWQVCIDTHNYGTVTYMLKVLNYFRDLDVTERRSCLYKVFCVVLGQKHESKDVPEVCSIGTDLLTEILVNWEQGTKPWILMFVVFIYLLG